MTTETALPPAQEATASGQQEAELQANTGEIANTGEDAAQEQQDAEGETKQKPEKTEAERERARLLKGIDRKTRQAAEARAERDMLRQEIERLRGSQSRDTNANTEDEPLTLSRAELAQMVKSEAERLAPTLKQQAAEIEHRTKVIEGLAKDLGQERFDELADELDENLGGLQRNGRPTPATEAIFAADDPEAVIKYLADSENAEEAEAIGRMDAVRASRAIAKLEFRLEQSKAESKPKRSKAPDPVEHSKGSGTINTMPNPADTKAYIKWANEQERRK